MVVLRPIVNLPTRCGFFSKLQTITRLSSHQSADEDAFTKLEHTNWQRAVDAYDEGFGALTSRVIPTLLEKACFPPTFESRNEEQTEGDTTCFNFLDVATGPGYVTSEAIKSALSMTTSDALTINYTAFDFSSNFLELARKYLPLNQNITYVEGDAQSMPFEDETFHFVVCNFGILHLSKPEAFLQESYRVLKPGGHLSFSAWATPPSTEGFDLILKVVNKVGNPNVTLPDGPPFFRFADNEEITTTLTDAGFKDLNVEEVKTNMCWDNVKSADELYDILLEGTARTRELLKGQTPKETHLIKIELREQFRDMLEEENNNGEKHMRSLRMPAIVSSGKKP